MPKLLLGPDEVTLEWHYSRLRKSDHGKNSVSRIASLNGRFGCEAESNL